MTQTDQLDAAGENGVNDAIKNTEENDATATALESKKNTSLKGYFIAFLGVACWATSEIFQTELKGIVPSMSKSFFRYFIGVMPLLLILLVKGDLKMKELFQRNRIPFLVAGGLACGIGNFVYFVGIVNTEPTIGSVIYGTYPIIISIYSIFLLNERGNLKRKMVGYVIGMFAIFGLMTDFEFSRFLERENFYGNFITLLGSIIFSFFNVMGKKVTSKEREHTTNIDIKFNVISFCIGMVVNFCLIMCMEEERTTFFHYDPRGWIFLILLGVITTGIGTLLFFVGIKQIPVSKGISVAMVKPIIVMFLVYFIYQRTPSIYLIITIPLVLLAIYFVTKN